MVSQRDPAKYGMQIVSFVMLTVSGVLDILAAERNLVFRIVGMVLAAAALVMLLRSIRQYGRERARVD